MNIWAIGYLAIQVFGLGVLLAKHGEIAKFNFVSSFLVWVFVTLPLLYMAGTFHA